MSCRSAVLLRSRSMNVVYQPIPGPRPCQLIILCRGPAGMVHHLGQGSGQVKGTAASNVPAAPELRRAACAPATASCSPLAPAPCPPTPHCHRFGVQPSSGPLRRATYGSKVLPSLCLYNLLCNGLSLPLGTLGNGAQSPLPTCSVARAAKGLFEALVRPCQHVRARAHRAADQHGLARQLQSTQHTAGMQHAARA